MSQTKSQSMFEAIAGSVFAFCLSLLTQAGIYPLFGFHITFTQNVTLVAVFTVISIVRSYFVRRFFNWLHSRDAH
jgi:hypothetical protein